MQQDISPSSANLQQMRPQVLLNNVYILKKSELDYFKWQVKYQK